MKSWCQRIIISLYIQYSSQANGIFVWHVQSNINCLRWNYVGSFTLTQICFYNYRFIILLMNVFNDGFVACADDWLVSCQQPSMFCGRHAHGRHWHQQIDGLDKPLPLLEGPLWQCSRNDNFLWIQQLL